MKNKILIVEDEGIVAKDLQNMLTDLGYEIVGVIVTGEEVLDSVKKLKPDLILMDIILKGKIDGIEATKRVRSLFDIPVIYVTAYADEVQIEAAKKTEAYGYILKPFTKNVLKADIEMALHHHKMVLQLKKNAQKIKRNLEEREVMLKEIHHRVKNNMQIISSLLSHQARQTKNKEAKLLFTESQARIQSIALIHENLYHSADFSNIDFSFYIKKLTQYLISLYDFSDYDVKFETDVSDIRLSMDEAIPCGLILNELVTNAIKYAFVGLKNHKKIIKILMRVEGQKIVLTVSDNGRGLPTKINPDKPTTLGFDLVNTLVKQLNGKLEIQHTKGSTFIIEFKRHEKRS